jgi:hypothetical protein
VFNAGEGRACDALKEIEHSGPVAPTPDESDDPIRLLAQPRRHAQRQPASTAHAERLLGYSRTERPWVRRVEGLLVRDYPFKADRTAWAASAARESVRAPAEGSWT